MPREDLSKVAENVRSTSKKSVKDDEIKLTKDPGNLVPSGCSSLDVAASETPHGAWHLGTMVNVVGDTTTGKSVQAITGLVTCAGDKRFKDHRLICDDVEAADNIKNMANLFPQKLLDKIEAPRPSADFPWSDTVEAFKANLYTALEEALGDGRPFIYLLDSLDGLVPQAEIDRVHEDAKRHLKGDKKETGSYNTEKVRELNEMLRVFHRELKNTNSLLIVVSQVRANFNAGIFAPKFKRNGGHALDHYCQQIVWLFKDQAKSHLKKTINGRVRTIGSAVKAKITKNRLTGKCPREINYDIYPSYGVDSVGSVVDWMEREGFWLKKGKTIDTGRLGIVGTRKEVIAAIEEQGLERKAVRAMARGWLEIEEKLNVERTRRF
jgi:RecA/RadA recombinase